MGVRRELGLRPFVRVRGSGGIKDSLRYSQNERLYAEKKEKRKEKKTKKKREEEEEEGKKRVLL